MNQPLVSVVMTTCNRVDYLPDAITSVRNQSHRNVELLVVDDGSTDGTSAFIETLADPALRYVRQPNQGLSVARNRGTELATGAFVAFLDDDDVWLDDKLERQLARFEQTPDIAAVYGHARQFVSPELSVSERASLEHLDGRVVPAPIACSMLIRRQVFDRVGPFDEALCVGIEMDWYARLCDLDLPVVMLDEVVYRRRLHRSNLNRENNGDQSERLRVLKQLIDRRRAAGGDRQHPETEHTEQ